MGLRKLPVLSGRPGISTFIRPPEPSTLAAAPVRSVTAPSLCQPERPPSTHVTRRRQNRVLRTSFSLLRWPTMERPTERYTSHTPMATTSTCDTQLTRELPGVIGFASVTARTLRQVCSRGLRPGRHLVQWV